MSKSQQPVVVIIGANGFIGSHVVDKLAVQGKITVRAFDRFSRKPQYHAAPNVKTIKGSIDDDEALRKAFTGADYIIYSLSATNPFVSDSNPYADIHSLLRTIEIFELAIKQGVTKIAFISSGGAVYGRSAETGIAHEGAVPNPVSPYGICKLSVEHYLEYFKRKYTTDYIVYRLSNPYGPRQIVKHNQGVIPAFLHKILHDEDISIFGDGSMSRDYIYIEDAAEMIADSFMKPNKHAVYNIGSGQQTTLNDIVSELKKTLNKDISVLYKDAPQTFLYKTTISIERFCEEFGQPQLTSFADGLARTIDHHLRTEETEV